jgi:hypothetical protein
MLKNLLRILLVLVSLTLSGCIKANTAITVQPDGTGEITTSLGFPIELVAEMTLQGIDPVKDLKQILFKNLGYGTKYDQSDDNKHEWLILTREFSSVEVLSDLLQKQDFVESFSLRRNRGFLQDEYVLDAFITLENFSNPLEFDVDDGAQDPGSAMGFPLDFQLSIRLPGKILETNGVYNASEKTITWTRDSSDAFELHAISESWNTLSLAVSIGLGILGICLVVAIVMLVIRSRRKSATPVADENVQQRLVESIQSVEEEEQEEQPEPSEPEKDEVFPPSKILAMIGARELLDQVNHHVLYDRGEITMAKGAIRLVWTDQRETAVTRGIMITVQDTETIMINGVPFPATREAAREGLISCLKGLTRE